MSEQEQNEVLEQKEGETLGQVQDAAPVEESAPAPEQEAPAETDEAAPAAEQGQPEDRKPEEEPAAKKGKGAVLTDVLLVLLLLAVLGFGGVYISDQMSKNRIPTPMEQAMQENEALTKEILELTPAYNEALNVLDLYAVYEDHQTKISAREKELQDENRAYAEMEAKCNDVRRRILALQHQIRTDDANNRKNALGRIRTGIYVGNLTTRTGKAYQNATITSITKSRISISTPTGRASFKTSDLDASDSNLPRLLRYAFGTYDIIDTSRFDADDTTSAPSAPRARSSAPAPSTQARDKNYTPKPGAPVVDTRTDEPSTPAPRRAQDQQTDDGLVPY